MISTARDERISTSLLNLPDTKKNKLNAQEGNKVQQSRHAVSDHGRCHGPRREGMVTRNLREDEQAGFGGLKSEGRNKYFLDHLLSLRLHWAWFHHLSRESRGIEEEAHGRASLQSPEYSQQEPRPIKALGY